MKQFELKKIAQKCADKLSNSIKGINSFDKPFKHIVIDHFFPENFVNATDEERKGYIIAMKRYAYKGVAINIDRLSYPEFSDLVASMQARIDFCSGEISAEQLFSRYWPTPLDESSIKIKSLKKDLCINGAIELT